MARAGCSVGLLAITTITMFTASSGRAVAAAPSLDERAAGQIAALQQIKRSLSGPERKLDSRLAVALRQERNRSALTRLPQLDTGVSVSPAGMTAVDIRADALGGDLLDRLKGVGAETRYASRRGDSVRASLPLAAIDEVSSWKDVRRIEVAVGAMTAQGAVVSEGDKAHAGDLARAARSVRGTGVKLCGLSDGVDSLAASQAAGELPAVDVLPGEEGGGDEGTAMLEIMHDVAPKAELGFATAFRSDASFADNIRALRFRGGCDVIVDDVLYFNEHPFQDGPIARSVDAVTADGALFFSAAGNEGNTIDGTSGNYEADFDDSGRGIQRYAGVAHDFDPGPGVQILQPLSPASSASVPVTLFWADPLGGAANDYDLYLLNGASNVVAFSQDVQDGDDDAYEILGTSSSGGARLRLAVVKFSGADRYFQLSALGGRFKDSSDGLVARVTPGVTRGHSAAVNAFSTAAVPAAGALTSPGEPDDPPNPFGPFPGPFASGQLPERFTSDGPRRVFFEADGTPITPTDFSSAGGRVRQKPDIAAADGVTTSIPGFAPFFGTSAAAPHAAAIAGLVLSGSPDAGMAEVRDAFEATALDLAPEGLDHRTGHGVVLADRVLDHTGATAQPLVRAAAPALTVATGDGDAFLERGEAAVLELPVTNDGDGRARGIRASVSAGDAQVVVAPRVRSYGSLDAGESRTRRFRLALPAGYPLGKRVPLDVRVRFAGALSPTATEPVIRTGQPAVTVADFPYAGEPVPIPDNDATGASVTIPVSGVGYASKVTFSIDGTLCTSTAGETTVGLDHTFVGDLIGTLTAPGGQTATLMSRDGAGGNNLCQVVFDDAAAEPFDSVALRQAPFTGSWRPASPLDDLASTAVDGDWTFRVVDAASRDIGNIRAASLHVTGFVE